MIETLHHFFELNNTLVFFLYGQVFFVLGLAIALQSRRHSRLQLASSLGWLAAFGLTHGLHEWGVIFIPIQAAYINEALFTLLQVLHVVLLALSFACLFQFGVDLLREWYPRLVILPLVIMVGWTLWFVLPGPALRQDLETWHWQASIWSRYMLGLPSGALAAYGLRYQAERQIKPLNLEHIYRLLRVAGLALGAYAILGGAIVPVGTFFPASWLNDTLLLNWFGIPAPVFRSLTGMVMAVAIIRALEVFDLEVDRLIEQMETEQGVTAERERIGRELHDGAIQQIYTAGLIVESAQRKLKDDPVVAGQRLERAMASLNEAIAALRVYMGELRPMPVTISLAEGLQQLTADPRLTTLMDVELILDLPETAVLNPAQTAHILAIVSESLANAARHARAPHVKIRAAQVNGSLKLTIWDNGQGFSAVSNQGGYGLRNMRDRARLLGGQLTIHSQPGHGTEIILVAPWEESA